MLTAGVIYRYRTSSPPQPSPSAGSKDSVRPVSLWACITAPARSKYWCSVEMASVTSCRCTACVCASRMALAHTAGVRSLTHSHHKNTSLASSQGKPLTCAATCNPVGSASTCFACVGETCGASMCVAVKCAAAAFPQLPGQVRRAALDVLHRGGAPRRRRRRICTPTAERKSEIDMWVHSAVCPAGERQAQEHTARSSAKEGRELVQLKFSRLRQP